MNVSIRDFIIFNLLITGLFQIALWLFASIVAYEYSLQPYIIISLTQLVLFVAMGITYILVFGDE